MSTAFDAASVILPQGSGYKAGKLYGWRPDVKQLQDIDVVQNTANGSRVNEQGLIEFVPANTPRWDWSEGVSCPSLLVQPQRTNLFTYSEEFDNAAWGKGSLEGITSNAINAPDGELTADLIIPTTDSGNHFVFQSITTVAGSSTAFVFAKAQTYNQISIFFGGSIQEGEIFTLTGSGSVTNTIADIVSKIIPLNNGWYLCISTHNNLVAESANIQYRLANGGVTTFSGDGVGGVYLWGAQFEEGSFATSYIKTEGSTATRNADVISKDGIASLIGQGAFSKYFEVLFFEAGTIEFSDATTDNLIQIGTSSAFDDFKFRIVRDTVEQANILGGAPAANTFYKLFGAAATNNASLIVDGTVIGSDTSVATFSAATITEIDFSNFKGKIKVGAWYLSRLTNSEGQSLTS